MSKFERVINDLILRLPNGERILPTKDRLASFADQGIQGVANVLMSVVLARSLPHQQFASIGFMLGVYYFMAGFFRANVVLPFIVAAAEEERHGRAADAWWRVSFVWTVLIAVGLAVLTGAAFLFASMNPGVKWMAYALAYATIATPALLLAEFARRWLYQAKLPATAALTSLIYAIAGGGAALANIKIRSGWMGAAAWTMAALAAFVCSYLALRPRPSGWRDAYRRWREYRHFALWQSACHLPYVLYNYAAVLLIGLFGGPLAAATFTAVRTITNPAISVVTAVDSLDKPRAARALVADGLKGLRRSVRRTRLLLVMVTGSYLGLLVIFAEPVLHLAFGSAYAGHATEVRLLAMAFFMICLNQPSETLLIVLRESKLMFAVRMITAVVAVVALWWGSRVAGVVGCAAALFAAQLLALANLRIAEYVAERRYAAAQPKDARVAPSAGA